MREKEKEMGESWGVFHAFSLSFSLSLSPLCSALLLFTVTNRCAPLHCVVVALTLSFAPVLLLPFLFLSSHLLWKGSKKAAFGPWLAT